MTALSRVVFASGKSDWSTPRDLFTRLSRQWGPFDLDAAADDGNRLCDVWLTESAASDGLTVDWRKAGAHRVWLNPPYGRGITGKWVEKAYAESLKGCRVVMLLPARTDAPWFHDFVKPHAFHVEFIRGRLRFGDAKSGAPFPSMVVVFEAQEPTP